MPVTKGNWQLLRGITYNLLFVKLGNESEIWKFFLHKSNKRAKFFMADTCHRIISPFFHVTKMYFHPIKTDLYSVKYTFILSPFFHDIKIYFHWVKINLYSVTNIFIYSFYASKICFYYMNTFSLNTFLESISGLPVRILLSRWKLKNITRMRKSC